MTRNRPVLLAGLMLATMIMGACSGASAAKSPAQGGAGNAGQVAVRSAVIVLGPTGSSAATLVLTLVNSASQTDLLSGIEVSAPHPTSTFISGGSLAIAPNQAIPVGHSGENHINLYGFYPTPSQIVPVTFVFRDHGRSTVSLKVVTATGVYAGIVPVPLTAPAS